MRIIQAFILKLVTSLENSSQEEGLRSLSKRDWVRLRDEYLEEIRPKCWAKELFEYCNNIGSGPLTLLMAFGSLGVIAVQECWDVAFYPN